MLFGGFAPAIAAAVIVRTGAPDAIGAMVIVAACLSGAVVLRMGETAHAPRR